MTDPVLATHITRSKMMDKFRFLYHRLDPVSPFLSILLSVLAGSSCASNFADPDISHMEMHLRISSCDISCFLAWMT